MEITNDFRSIPLTSSEAAYLWTTYMMNSKSKYILMYKVEKSDNSNIREVFRNALDLSEKNLKKVEVILNTVKHPIPFAFDLEDVNIKANKLFSDVLMLHLLKGYSTFGLANAGVALSLASRADVRQFFTDNLLEAIKLANQIDEVALEMGIFIKTPHIPVPERVEFAHRQSFLGAFIGHKRQLATLEITHVFNTCMSDYVSKAYLLGLSQTTVNDRVKDFLIKSHKVFGEHAESLKEVLIKENLSTPISLDSEVVNSREPIYSDRFTMFSAIATLQEMLNVYSIAKLSCLRKDLILVLTQLSGELMMLLKDAMDISLDNGWVEEMPKAVDRKDIIEDKR